MLGSGDVCDGGGRVKIRICFVIQYDGGRFVTSTWDHTVEPHGVLVPCAHLLWDVFSRTFIPPCIATIANGHCCGILQESIGVSI